MEPEETAAHAGGVGVAEPEPRQTRPVQQQGHARIETKA